MVPPRDFARDSSLRFSFLHPSRLGLDHCQLYDIWERRRNSDLVYFVNYSTGNGTRLSALFRYFAIEQVTRVSRDEAETRGRSLLRHGGMSWEVVSIFIFTQACTQVHRYRYVRDFTAKRHARISGTLCIVVGDATMKTMLPKLARYRTG